MAEIMKRQDVMTKLAGGYRAQTEEAVGKINKLINDAKVFPILIPTEVIGTMPPVVEQIKKQLGQGGWIVTPKAEGLEIG